MFVLSHCRHQANSEIFDNESAPAGKHILKNPLWFEIFTSVNVANDN